MPKPIGSVTPGALNFSHAPIKLTAQIKPIQVKAQMTATGCSAFDFFGIVFRSIVN